MTTPPSGDDLLIVDDDRAMRTLLSDILGLAGYRVRAARDGIEAISACEELIPRLILLDLAMPRLDGLGFLSELTQRGWQDRTTVLVVTARRSACPEALERGAADCMEKPFDIDELAERVSQLIPAGRVSDRPPTA